MKGYLAALPAGADPTQGIAAANAARTKYERMSGPGGSVYSFDPYSNTGGKQDVAGTPQLLNPDGTLNTTVLGAQATAKERLAAAQRAGAPLAPRAAKAAKPAKRGSYDASEVKW